MGRVRPSTNATAESRRRARRFLALRPAIEVCALGDDTPRILRAIPSPGHSRTRVEGAVRLCEASGREGRTEAEASVSCRECWGRNPGSSVHGPPMLTQDDGTFNDPFPEEVNRKSRARVGASAIPRPNVKWQCKRKMLLANRLSERFSLGLRRPMIPWERLWRVRRCDVDRDPIIRNVTSLGPLGGQRICLRSPLQGCDDGIDGRNAWPDGWSSAGSMRAAAAAGMAQVPTARGECDPHGLSQPGGGHPRQHAARTTAGFGVATPIPQVSWKLERDEDLQVLVFAGEIDPRGAEHAHDRVGLGIEGDGIPRTYGLQLPGHGMARHDGRSPRSPSRRKRPTARAKRRTGK